jgi:hypothetical protein
LLGYILGEFVCSPLVTLLTSFWCLQIEVYKNRYICMYAEQSSKLGSTFSAILTLFSFLNKCHEYLHKCINCIILIQNRRKYFRIITLAPPRTPRRCVSAKAKQIHSNSFVVFWYSPKICHFRFFWKYIFIPPRYHTLNELFLLCI